MALPSVPTGYDSWNQYIEEQGALIADAQSITFQEGKASVKLLYVALPARQNSGNIEYRDYNLFTTWADRATGSTVGRPWASSGGGSPPSSSDNIKTETNDDLQTEDGKNLSL